MPLINERLTIAVGDEILFVDLPETNGQHVVTCAVDAEGVSVFLNGNPVNLETGTTEMIAPAEVIEAADQLVKIWAEHGSSAVLVSDAVAKYSKFRTTAFQQHLPTVQPTSPIVESSLPKNSLKEGWSKFVANIQKKYPPNPGIIITCPGCNNHIPSFTDLRAHWEAGHYDNEPITEDVNPARAYMPQREGPSKD